MGKPMAVDRLRVDVVTLFPDMIHAQLQYGVVGRARERGLLQVQCWNPRDFSTDNHRSVDDRPYGGGPGMVMMIEPLRQAITAARAARAQATAERGHVVYLSPQGRPLTQEGVAELAHTPGLILLAGRYEGVDERLLDMEVDAQWSLGDYVLSGGELPALVVIDAMTRLIPGALGDADSAQQDSFMNGLLDCPHYTRPEDYEGRTVPAVLLSGHHEQIAAWRHKQALGRTWQRRPELLEQRGLDDREKKLLSEYIDELKQGKHET